MSAAATRRARAFHVPDEHLRLMYEDGLSQRDIADAIGGHQTTVGVRLRRMGISKQTRKAQRG